MLKLYNYLGKSTFSLCWVLDFITMALFSIHTGLLAFSKP